MSDEEYALLDDKLKRRIVDWAVKQLHKDQLHKYAHQTHPKRTALYTDIMNAIDPP